MNCPICRALLTQSTSMATEGTIEEDSEQCPNKCYYYQFLYGHTEVWVCGVRFQRSYTDEYPSFHCWNEAIQLVMRLNSHATLFALMEFEPPLPGEDEESR